MSAEVETLRQEVASLRDLVMRIASDARKSRAPLARVFIVKKGEDPKAWTENTIDAGGELAEAEDGRSAEEGDVGEMIDLVELDPDAYLMAEVDSVAEGNPVMRYVKIATGGLMYVTLTSDGGDAGNKTTPCSFTYTVTGQGGEELGTEIAPAMQRRAIGRCGPAANGIGMMSGESFLLIWCDEVSGAVACDNFGGE